MAALIIAFGLFVRSRNVQVNRLSTTLADYRQALLDARTSGTGPYAASCLQGANVEYERVMTLWREQNQRSFFIRDLGAVKSAAVNGIASVKNCALHATAVRDSLKRVLLVRMPLQERTLKQVRRNYAHLPVKDATRRNLVTAEMLCSEARSANNRSDYLTASAKLTKSEQLLALAANDASRMVESFLEGLPLWDVWARETIAKSRKTGGTAVIVDKMAGTCRLYSAGVLKHEFHAEFGPNWMKQKTRRGDDATPEGRYTVIRRKAGAQTKYYKALEINYPNDDDLARFRALQEAGQLPSSASPGNLIEIHGGGGKFAHWTDGCVALRNSDMDKVYALSPMGMPITIVGALSSTLSPELSSEHAPLR